MSGPQGGGGAPSGGGGGGAPQGGVRTSHVNSAGGAMGATPSARPAPLPRRKPAPILKRPKPAPKPTKRGKKP